MSFITPTDAPATAGSPAAPDWATITRDVTCPLCAYNLRGLVDPRCPECGYQFEWPAVLEPDRHRHPYLFEHHPRRNVRSFIQTLFRSPLSPANFWHTLDPAQEVRLGRLVLYWVLYATVALLLPTILGIGWIILRQYQSPWATLAPTLRNVAANVEYSGVVTSVVLLAFFPWFNFLALMVFQQSMRRRRVRAAHVLRCAMYCGDVVLWFSMAATVAVVMVDPRDVFRRIGHPAMALFLGHDPLLALLGCGLLAMLMINALRLWVAYRSYLRFTRALSLIVASQIVVVLSIFAAMTCASEYMR